MSLLHAAPSCFWGSSRAISIPPVLLLMAFVVLLPFPLHQLTVIIAMIYGCRLLSYHARSSRNLDLLILGRSSMIVLRR